MMPLPLLSFWSSFFAAPIAALALLALIPPLVIFYFLKLRRPKVEVPSLTLWRQVMEDQRVNSPFQRFRKNILLLLQLLILLFLIIASLRPFFNHEEDPAENIPIMLDISASMGARSESGKTRLEEAKEIVLQRIDALSEDQRMAIVVYDSQAQKISDFTNNKRLLRSALNDVKVSDKESDLESAARMIKGMQRSALFEKAILITDGNFDDVHDFELSYALEPVLVGTPANNMGITDFQASATRDGNWAVFVRVASSAQESMTGSLELYKNDELAYSDAISVSRGSDEKFEFQVDVQELSLLRLVIKPDGHDAIEVDNTAYLTLMPRRSLAGYVPPHLKDYRYLLQVIEGVDVYPNDQGDRPESGGFDLVISDQASDQSVEAPVSLFIGMIPNPLSQVLVYDESEDAVISKVIDWERSSGILAYTVLTDMTILDHVKYQSGYSVREMESLNYRVIADGQAGPLMLEERLEEARRYYMLFHSDRSTLPYRVAMPVMVQNLVNLSRSYASQAKSDGMKTGAMRPLLVEPKLEYELKGPDGNRVKEISSNEGRLTGLPAPKVGIYELYQNGEMKGRYGAALLSTMETQLDSKNTIMFDEIEVPVTQTPQPVRWLIWPILAIIALVILVVEWWFFEKRPGGLR